MSKLKKRKFVSLSLACLLALASFLPPAAMAADSKNDLQTEVIPAIQNKARKSQIKGSPYKAKSVFVKNQTESLLETKLKDKLFKGKVKKETFVPDELIITFKKTAQPAGVGSVLSKFSLKTEKQLDAVGGQLVKIPKGKDPQNYINALKNDPMIQSVQRNYKYYPSEENNATNYYNKLWGLNNTGQSINGIIGEKDIDVDAPEAWENTKTKLAEVVVGVIDTGVDINHPDLKDKIWTNPGEIPNDNIDNDRNGYVDDVNGWDFYNKDNTVFDPLDGDAHGTHVSGTIAAALENNDRKLNKGAAGVAPNVKIMPIKFLGPDGGTTADAILAIDYANKMGVKLTNNSWGGYQKDPLLKAAIDHFNGLFLAAAGNDGMNTDEFPTYPASYESSNILAVAALDNNGQLASFSNYSDKSVDVAAPGVNILSTVPKLPAKEFEEIGIDVGAAAEISAANYKAIFNGIGFEKLSGSERADAFSKALNFLGVNQQSSKILLVQDDENNLAAEIGDQIPELQNYFKNYLPVYKTLLKGYQVKTVTLSSSASLADKLDSKDLENYDAVIWFTGHGVGFTSEEGTTLTSSDIESLSNYLTKGGNLLLTGQDALSGIETSAFVQNLLHLDVTANMSNNLNAAGQDGTIYAGKKYNVNQFESPFPFADFVQSNDGAAKVNLKYLSEYSQAYSYYSGTSMAAPHATGTAAIFMGLYPGLSPELVKLYISKKGKQLDELNGLVNSGSLVKASKFNSFNDNGLPGTPLVKNMTNGTLNMSSDKDDVFAYSLREGEVLSLGLSGKAGTDFDLYVYNDSANDIKSANGLVGYSENVNSSNESLTFTAPATGVYFIDVYSYQGSGGYTLSVGNFGGEYENSSNAVSVTGPWTVIKNPQHSGGSASVLNTKGELQFSFVGYGFEWIGFKDSLQGIADIYIDGKKEKSPSLYSSDFKAKQMIFRKQYADYGAHSVKIVWTGISDPSARKSAVNINVDKFIVKDTLPTVYYDTWKKAPSISWLKVPWASSYHVYRKELSEKDFKRLTSSPVSSLSFVDPKAAFGKTYVYAVSMIRNGKETPLSKSFMFIYDDDVKGSIPLKTNTGKGSLNVNLKDVNDVWSIQLEQGKTYEFTLSGPASANFDLQLFNKGISTIYSGKPLVSSTTPASFEKIVFKPLQTGLYYLVPTAKSGAGKYSLTAAVQAAGK